MYLAKRIKVPQWNLSFFYAIIFLSSTIRPAVCSDSSANLNSDNYANSNRRVPTSGSGGGSPMGKRSSYAVLSQAMSETINNEFGSKYPESYDDCFALRS